MTLFQKLKNFHSYVTHAIVATFQNHFWTEFGVSMIRSLITGAHSSHLTDREVIGLKRDRLILHRRKDTDAGKMKMQEVKVEKKKNDTWMTSNMVR